MAVGLGSNATQLGIDKVRSLTPDLGAAFNQLENANNNPQIEALKSYAERMYKIINWEAMKDQYDVVYWDENLKAVSSKIGLNEVAKG